MPSHRPKKPDKSKPVQAKAKRLNADHALVSPWWAPGATPWNDVRRIDMTSRPGAVKAQTPVRDPLYFFNSLLIAPGANLRLFRLRTSGGVGAGTQVQGAADEDEEREESGTAR